jgi:hypothetical protein
MKRRAAVEPVIGHLKAEHRLGRNHLAHRTGDAINAVLDRLVELAADDDVRVRRA